MKQPVQNPPLLEAAERMNYDYTRNETKGVTVGLPSRGTPKVLVIPIAFTDAPAPTKMKKNLEVAFFGYKGQTG